MIFYGENLITFAFQWVWYLVTEVCGTWDGFPLLSKNYARANLFYFAFLWTFLKLLFDGNRTQRRHFQSFFHQPRRTGRKKRISSLPKYYLIYKYLPPSSICKLHNNTALWCQLPTTWIDMRNMSFNGEGHQNENNTKNRSPIAIHYYFIISDYNKRITTIFTTILD